MKYSYYNDLYVNESLHKFMDENKFLSFWRDAIAGLKIHPHQSQDETLKKHSYPGFLNYINKINYLSELEYIRRDTYMGITYFTNLKTRYKMYLEGDSIHDHETRTLKKGLDKLCKELEDKGVELSDFDPTIKWFREVALKAITARKKYLKEKYPD